MLIEFGSEGEQVRSLLSGGYVLALVPVSYFAWLVNSAHPLNTGVPQKSLRRILGAMAEAATAAAPLPTDPPHVLETKRQLAIEYGKLNHGRLEYREKLTVRGLPCTAVLTSALRLASTRFRLEQRRVAGLRFKQTLCPKVRFCDGELLGRNLSNVASRQFQLRW
jgi:hypothetical protein